MPEQAFLTLRCGTEVQGRMFMAQQTVPADAWRNPGIRAAIEEGMRGELGREIVTFLNPPVVALTDGYV